MLSIYNVSVQVIGRDRWCGVLTAPVFNRAYRFYVGTKSHEQAVAYATKEAQKQAEESYVRMQEKSHNKVRVDFNVEVLEASITVNGVVLDPSALSIVVNA